MPVRKHRSVEDMKQPAWLPAGDPSIPGLLRYLGRLASAFPRAVGPRGVRKYRSIEESDLARQAWASSSGRTNRPV